MKFKANDWLDTKDRQVYYGIDGYIDGRWLHVATDGNPLFFTTKEERDEYIKVLQKRSENMGK